MATYENSALLTASPWGRTTTEELVFTEASRTYANADIIKCITFDLGVKTNMAWVFLEPLDVHAAPTATAELQLYDGTTTKKLKTLTAAEIKAGGLYFADEIEGVGFVTTGPKAGSASWYLRLIFTAVFATAQAGIVKIGWRGNKMLFKGEEVLVS